MLLHWNIYLYSHTDTWFYISFHSVLNGSMEPCKCCLTDQEPVIQETTDGLPMFEHLDSILILLSKLLDCESCEARLGVVGAHRGSIRWRAIHSLSEVLRTFITKALQLKSLCLCERCSPGPAADGVCRPPSSRARTGSCQR